MLFYWATSYSSFTIRWLNFRSAVQLVWLYLTAVSPLRDWVHSSHLCLPPSPPRPNPAFMIFWVKSHTHHTSFVVLCIPLKMGDFVEGPATNGTIMQGFRGLHGVLRSCKEKTARQNFCINFSQEYLNKICHKRARTPHFMENCTVLRKWWSIST